MEKQAKNIRWGIIGLGGIAHKFAHDLLTVEGCELYAVASRSQDKADAFASQYGASKAYDTYEALANDPQIDAAYIATPHSLHKDNTVMCLKKGIPVLCEKPFAMNLEEVRDMIRVSKEHNTLLMEALWTRFLPHYNYVLKLMNEKTYGDILKFEASFGFYRVFNGEARLFNKSVGGGSLLDLGIYPIFAALTILGKPQQIEAQATFFDNGADSHCNMTFNYPNNVSAHLECSLIKDLPTEAIIHFEKGIVKIDRQFHAPSSITISMEGKTETKSFECNAHGYNYEIEHFNQLLRSGKTESDLMSFDFSKQLIKTIDDVRLKIGLEYN